MYENFVADKDSMTPLTQQVTSSKFGEKTRLKRPNGDESKFKLYEKNTSRSKSPNMLLDEQSVEDNEP